MFAKAVGARSWRWVRSASAARGALCILLGLAGVVEGAEIAGYRATPLTVSGTSRPGFSRMPAAETGVGFSNYVADARSITNRNLLSGSGVATGDFDGDGRVDLYFCGLEPANALYRNLGGWKFQDVTAEANVACAGQDSTGAAFADVDGDGDLDLLVNGLGHGTRLFRNEGGGRFAERTDEAGLRSPAAATSMALADIDGDGDLDLYVTHFRVGTIRDLPTTNLRVEYVAGRPVITHLNGIPTTRSDLTNRFELAANGSVTEYAEADALYLNDGQGRFTKESFTGGRFLDENGRPLRQPPYDWGLAAQFYDFTGDGAPDLYVCNDLFTPDRIWVNDGTGRFRAIDRLAVRNLSTFSMGVDFGDLNRDGYPDFFVVDMLSREHAKRQVQMSEVQGLHRQPGVYEDRPQIGENTLYVNRGDATFAQIARFAGVEASEWSWGPIFLDVDLDGWEDIIVSNGQDRDFQNADISQEIERIKAARALSHAELLKLFTLFPDLRSPKIIFHNQQNLRFTEVGRAWGLGDAEISQGMAVADLDNDGDLDLAINNLKSVAALYRNEAAAPRVAVRLRGQGGNTRGIGARVTLAGGPVDQTQEMIAGGRYLSGDHPMRTFAAQTSDKPLRIEVRWRSGRRSVVESVPPNTLVEIEEQHAAAAPAPEPPRPDPFFEDVSSLLNHRHADEPFDDWQRQPLLPMRLSELGPGVAWHDWDGDGWDDLAIGGGRGGRIGFFRNRTGQGFTNVVAPAFQRLVARDQTTVLGLQTILLAGSSNNEDGVTNGGWLRVYDMQRIAAGENLLGPDFATGPLALADVDGDGSLDLFVGGGGIAGRFPAPAASFIARNQGNRFVPGQRFEKLGLVRGAAFSDFDGDGDPDLVLACQWGPLKVLRNDGGSFTEATRDWGLAGQQGLWNSVATADLDQDGRPDLIAGNWGWNSKWRASAKHPLRLHHGDFDGDGVFEVVEGRWEEALRKEVPLRGLRFVASALPWVAERIGTFAKYGTSSVAEIYGDRMAGAAAVEATTLASMVFMNRGGKFEGQPLPVEAQWAPVFGIAVADFDGDGYDDVFLGQNFFGTNFEMPRADGGRGLWLRGDGKGGLTPMRSTETGVYVYGEARAAAVSDYDQDGRPDLVVTQNSAETKLFRNRRAAPGLAVRMRGSESNPDSVGGSMRLTGKDGFGPIREIQAGSGYWSQNSRTVLLGRREGEVRIEWRTPGGMRYTNAVPAQARRITLDSTTGRLTSE